MRWPWIFVFATASCAEPTCSLDEQAARFGPGTKDCGRASATDTTSVNACVAAALADGTAFRATYLERGIDSEPATVVIKDASGAIAVLGWDSDPSGGGNIGAHLERFSCTTLARVTDDQGIVRYRCSGTQQRLGVVCDNGKVR